MSESSEREKQLENEVETLKATLEKEETLMKELESSNSQLQQEKKKLQASLEEKGELSNMPEQVNQLQAQKNALDLELQVSRIATHGGFCATRNV